MSLRTSLDALTYPVLTLPPEITSRIFLHCFAFNLDDRPSLRRAPGVLLLVCKTWKEIALTTHGLWTRLDLTKLDTLMPEQDLIEIISRWFLRAGTLPVSLTLRRWFYEQDALVHSVLSPRSSQLQSLTLDVSLHDLPNVALKLPLLQKLTLCTNPWESDSVPEHLQSTLPFKCFSAAPQLREVWLQIPTNPELFLLPWHSLTKFTGDGLTAEQCLFVLRSASSLVACTFTGRFDGPVSDLWGCVDLHHLRYLNLTRSLMGEETGQSVATILDLLHAPDLERLELMYIPDLYQFEEQMRNFFSRVSASLRYFSFAADEDEEELIPSTVDWWFEELPNLTHVAFIDPNLRFMDTFLGNLSLNDHFLPCLTTLRLLDYFYPISHALILALLFRSAPPEPPAKRALLKAFDLVWISPAHIPDLTPYVPFLELLANRGGMAIFVGVNAGKTTEQMYPVPASE